MYKLWCYWYLNLRQWQCNLISSDCYNCGPWRPTDHLLQPRTDQQAGKLVIVIDTSQPAVTVHPHPYVFPSTTWRDHMSTAGEIHRGIRISRVVHEQRVGAALHKPKLTVEVDGGWWATRLIHTEYKHVVSADWAVESVVCGAPPISYIRMHHIVRNCVATGVVSIWISDNREENMTSSYNRWLVIVMLSSLVINMKHHTKNEMISYCFITNLQH